MFLFVVILSSLSSAEFGYNAQTGSTLTIQNVNYTIIQLNDTGFTAANATLARIGDCPTGQVVQNTTTSGVICVPQSQGNLSFNQSLTNSLYANIQWNYNQTIPANAYTDSQVNKTFNQSLTDLLYASIIWNYNQSAPVFSYITTNEPSWLSTYNATYANNIANNSFNQSLTDSLYRFKNTQINASEVNKTTGTFFLGELLDSILDQIKTLLNSLETNKLNVTDQRYNDTAYISNVNLSLSNRIDNVVSNSTFNQSLTDTLYYSIINPNGFINNTFNATYDATTKQWNGNASMVYNHTVVSNAYTDSVVSANNASWTSTYNATYAANIANNSFNQSLADTLYAGIQWAYNQTTPAITYADATFLKLTGGIVTGQTNFSNFIKVNTPANVLFGGSAIEQNGNTYMGSGSPQIIMDDQSQTADNRTFRILNDARNFSIQTINNAGTIATDSLVISRTGNSINSVSFPNGNVGIGTTTPTVPLQVGTALNGNTAYGGSFRVNSTGRGFVFEQASPTGIETMAVGHMSSGSSSRPIFTVFKGNGATDAFATTVLEVNSDNKVKITGDTNITGKLEVGSTSIFREYIAMYLGNTLSGYIGRASSVFTDGTNSEVGIRSEGNLLLGSQGGGSSQMKLQSGLVNITNSNLDVAGNISAHNFKTRANAPSSPAIGDLWYETDTNILWFWDGTYWLSEELFTSSIYGNQQSITVTSSWTGFTFPGGVGGTQYNVYLVDMFASPYVATTSDATNYWDVKIDFLATDASSITSKTIDTKTITANNGKKFLEPINYFMNMSDSPSSLLYVITSATKVNSPGALYGNAGFTYRLANT